MKGRRLESTCKENACMDDDYICTVVAWRERSLDRGGLLGHTWHAIFVME